MGIDEVEERRREEESWWMIQTCDGWCMKMNTNNTRKTVYDGLSDWQETRQAKQTAGKQTGRQTDRHT